VRFLTPSLVSRPTEDSSQHNALTKSPRKLRFLQLYTSKSYESRRSELVKPEDDDENNMTPNSKKKHVLSPRLVETIARTTQLVWANVSSMTHNGLNGRSDIPLNTAVGMPVAIDGMGNMCVVVMFSPNDIESTDDAVQYLQSISQSATSSSIPCLLPVVDPRFVGRLPPPSAVAGRNSLGKGVVVKCVPLNQLDWKTQEAEVTSAPIDTYGIPMLPDFGNDVLDIFDDASYGIWSTIMDTEGVWSDALMDSMAQMGGDDPSSLCNVVSEPTLQVVLAQKASLSDARRIRLEEFCHGFLGMSVFDIADIWVPAGDEQPDCLRHVTTVLGEKNPVLEGFERSSVNALIQVFTGAVGRAYSSREPVWSVNSSGFVDPARAEAFQAAQIRTALAVPVFQRGSDTPTCIVACYSLVHIPVVPFTLKFVQQALRLLWSGLDQVEPHESVGPQVWKDVDPADLGEMAADEEMHQHFLIKKRPHNLISAIYTDERQAAEGNLADRMQAVSIPSDGSSLVARTNSAPSGVDIGHVRNHLLDAIRSVSSVVAFQSIATNAEGTKRAHVGPLPMPRGLPKAIVTPVDSRQVDELPPSTKPPSQVSEPHNVAWSVAASNVSLLSVQQQGNAIGDAQNLLSFAELNVVHVPVDIDGMHYCLPVSSSEVRTCKIEGCESPAVSRRPYCTKHCGSRQCETEGCSKCAQGATRFCIAHLDVTRVPATRNFAPLTEEVNGVA
jgi:hypothetical protein